MNSQLDVTFKTLRESRNEAALRVLEAALQRREGRVFDNALKSLVLRRSKPGQLMALKVMHTLPPDKFDLLETGRGRMSAALRDAVLDGDDQLFKNACGFISEFSEFDSIATLLVVAEDVHSPRHEEALRLILELVERLVRRIHGPRDENQRGDLDLQRHNILEQVENSVTRYRNHQRDELVEAYVTLAVPTSGELRAILDAPHHTCYRPVIRTLTHSQSIGVIRLLIGFLVSADAPSAVLKVIGHRTDDAFISRLAAKAAEGLRPNAQRNFKRITSFAWMDQSDGGVSALPAEQQANCVQLAMHSGIPESVQMKLFVQLHQQGSPAAREAACRAVTRLQSQGADRYLIAALDDKQPEVVALAAPEVRHRRLPGVLPSLLRMLDSPHEVVREAARGSLSEFNFASFVARFDSMEERVQRSTAKVVKKVDAGANAGLVRELRSAVRSARLRALSMAEMLGGDDTVVGAIIKMLQDKEHVIRMAAAETLSHFNTPGTREALRASLSDKSRSVAIAAETSLATLDALAEPTAGRT